MNASMGIHTVGFGFIQNRLRIQLRYKSTQFIHFTQRHPKIAQLCNDKKKCIFSTKWIFSEYHILQITI